MKKIKLDFPLIFTFLLVVVLTVYVISANSFSILESGLSQFIIGYIFILFILSLSLIIQIFVHELGHLVFGLLSSYEFSSFRILNFLILKKNGKLKLERYTIPGTAGQCLMKPKNKDLGLKSALLFNLGGGLMNIIVSLLLIFLDYKYFSETSVSIYLRALIAGGIFSALTNLIPMKTGQITNDGANIVQLIKHPHFVEVFNETLTIQDYITRGFIFEQIPEELLYYNDKYDYNSSLLSGSLAFYHASLINSENYKEAYTLGEKVLQAYPEMIGHYQNYFEINLLFFDILKLDQEKDIKNRYQEFQKIIKLSPNSLDILRLQYAYFSLIKKNFELAEEYKENYEKFLKLAPFPADIKIEEQLFLLTETMIDFQTKEISK